MTIGISEINDYYLTPEFDTFIEHYCKEKGITSQELANNIDQFELALSLYDKSIKKDI